jgi:hypothetical protein
MQKFAPLIILALFVVAAIVIVQGLNKADELAHPKKTERPTP